MRVSELAKELKIPSKELLEKLKALRVSVKSATSTLDADAVNRARKALKAKPSAKAPAAVRRTTTKTAPKAGKAPSKAEPAVVQRAAPAPARPAPVTATPPRPAAPVQPVVSHPSLTGPPAATATMARPTATAAPPKPKPRAVAPPKPKPKAREPVAAPAPPVVPTGPPTPIEVRFPITVKDLAAAVNVSASDLIKQLMQQGVFASLLQALDQPTATKIASGFNIELRAQPSLEDQLVASFKPDPANMKPRAPVVTLMGHVDHGKTSLLDAIRKSKVAEREAGGITQHIGAYEVLLEKGRVIFLDTPGHEAFTALRARGAHVTDIVVLVVAADDGVMPQTIEAMDHAKAAEVPIVVAINKSDLPDANPQKIKQQLSQYGLLAEDWGGKTIMVSVSAKTGDGLDGLLEMLLLEAELLELKADAVSPSSGVVIEAKQTKDRGPVATVLVQQGTLRIGDPVVTGTIVGRIRAMVNDRGHRVKEAGPATPVELLGLPDVPKAGDSFWALRDERLAKQLAEQRQEQRAQQAAVHPQRITLEQLHQRIAEGKLKDLRLILKADVQGSLEAIEQSLQKLDTEKEEVQFKILHRGVGDINESDVILAAASDAIIVGFHVGINPQVQVLAATEGVDVHIFQIIYELVNTVKGAIEGLLEPTLEETFLGRAEVRKLFQVSKVGMVAGCMVVKGTVRRDCTIRVVRGKERVFEGKIATLKRVKDDVREVQEGIECGIALDGNVDVQIGDLVEAWELKKVARKLA